MSNNRHLSADFNLKHRPSSLSPPTPRPVSEQISSNYKSPEAQAIDKWFEDLNYYEKTLEDLGNTRLDESFQDELAAIENWFRVLSETERTACIHSLLKGTTPLQIRFFTTVLQQMVATKDSDPLSSSMLLSPSATKSEFRPEAASANQPEDLGRLYRRPKSNSRLSSEFNVRAILRSSSSQDEFSDEHSPKKDELGSSWPVSLTQRSSSLHMPETVPKPISKPSLARLGTTLPPRGPSEKSPTSPLKSGIAYSHITARTVPITEVQVRQVGKSTSVGRVSLDEEEWDAQGITLSRPKDRIVNESINLSELQGGSSTNVDVPTWFRSLRLHKYTTIFEKDDWREIIKMSEDQLIERGVAALGARRKMLKVFEAARAELQAKVRVTLT